MKTITEQLTATVSAAFTVCGYDASLGVVTVSDRADLCQFQCNGALGGAKLHHKAPRAIAEDVAARLRADARFRAVDIAGPGFINLTLTDEALLEAAAAVAADEHLGVPQADVPQTVVIDYGGPNVAKPLHIGHLRSAIIGEAIKRLTRMCGHRAIGDVHLGDWGTPMGLVITELHDRHPDWRCFAEDFDPAHDTVPALDAPSLNEIYPFASARKKTDEDFAARAHQATFDLQNGRPGYLALWQEILKVSVGDIRAAYEKLNVSFDYWYGESDADKYVPELMDILTQKALVRTSEGAQIVEVAREDDTAPMPPILVRKSDGSITYETTDLATILQRQRDFAPDRILYLTDARQGLHFEQVFRAARRAELVPESTALDFLGFGTMNGADGKPYKTRDGGVMQLSDLLATATDAAYEKLCGSTYLDSLNEAEKRELAQKVGIAAVKFGDLINNPARDYVFDLDKFLSFEGKTGTYLLYTVTRINSILKRTGEPDGTIRGIYSDTERELLLKILLTGDVFRRALAEKAPSFLAENAYQLASLFSKFYHDNRVIDEPDADKRASWLALMALVRRELLLHLDILAIDAVENM